MSAGDTRRSLDDDDSLSSCADDNRIRSIPIYTRHRGTRDLSMTGRRPRRSRSRSDTSMDGSYLREAFYLEDRSSPDRTSISSHRRLRTRTPRARDSLSQRGQGNEQLVLPMGDQSPSSSREQPVSLDGPNPPRSRTPSPESLTHRLHVLLDEVISVIRSYSTALNPSARRVQALHSFYDRIYDLLHPPSPDLFAAGVDSTGIASRRGLTAEHVERLEREWWESEVVAAWYGPVPALHAVRSPVRPLPVRLDVGARQAPESGHDNPRGGSGVEPGLNANQRDRVETIKRDASYVGLYDE